MADLRDAAPVDREGRALRVLRENLETSAEMMAARFGVTPEILAQYEGDEGIDGSKRSLSRDGVREYLEVLLAIGAGPAPDTGWRDRAPTEAEVRAHAMAHRMGDAVPARGLWLARWDACLAWQFPYVTTVVLLIDALDGKVWRTMNGVSDRMDDLWRRPSAWRPLTASGDPAPWPEVTP